MVKVGVSSLHLIDRPFGDLQRRITGLRGIDFWEVIDEGNHTLDHSRVAKLRKIQRSTSIGFSVHAPFVDVNIATFSPWLRAPLMRRLERSLRFASRLRAACWTIHPGLLSRSVIFPQRSWDLNVKATKRLIKTASRVGVQLAVENMPRSLPFLLKTRDDFERFFAEFSEPVKMTLDIGHANTNGQLVEIIGRFRERIAEVHVHDNLGDDEHKPAGNGSVNWGVVRERLKGFRGLVTIEWVPVLQDDVQRAREIFAGD